MYVNVLNYTKLTTTVPPEFNMCGSVCLAYAVTSKDSCIDCCQTIDSCRSYSTSHLAFYRNILLKYCCTCASMVGHLVTNKRA